MISPRRLTPIAALVAGAIFALASPALPDGSRLAFSSDGRGEPAIVLIHGAGQDRHLWDGVAPLLEPAHRVIRVDLPGHGASPPLSRVSVREVATALDRTLEQEKVKQAVLVGQAYGAFVALEEAAAHPSRVRAIIPIDIPSYIAADSERIANLEALVRDRYPLFLIGVFKPMTKNPANVDSVMAAAERVEPDVLTAYFRETWRMDLRPRIRKIKQPILVILTDDSWPPAESWSSARKRLGYETAGPAVGRRMAGSGHLVPLDQPDSLAAAILHFTATLPR